MFFEKKRRYLRNIIFTVFVLGGRTDQINRSMAHSLNQDSDDISIFFSWLKQNCNFSNTLNGPVVKVELACLVSLFCIRLLWTREFLCMFMCAWQFTSFAPTRGGSSPECFLCESWHMRCLYRGTSTLLIQAVWHRLDFGQCVVQKLID